MIGRLQGKLAEKNPPRLLIDVNGVGYEVDVPMSTFYNLPGQGETITLLIHHVMREDGQFLYGFLSGEERESFRHLLKISGIGARTALAVLSGLSVSDLRLAVARQESSHLTRIPGIGKKTAERLLLELKGKLSSSDASADIQGMAGMDNDVQNALVALGYSEKEALAAQKALPAGLPVSEAIRQALKNLAKF